MKNASDVSKKWSRNLAASTESIKAGVQAVTTSPTEQAAQAQDRYLAGVQRAAADGKFARNLRKVTLQDWQQAILTKGISRIATGAAAAQPKMEAFMNKWLPYEDQLKQKLKSMPRGDLQTNIQRAVVAIEHNAAFQG